MPPPARPGAPEGSRSSAQIGLCDAKPAPRADASAPLRRGGACVPKVRRRVAARVDGETDAVRKTACFPHPIARRATRAPTRAARRADGARRAAADAGEVAGKICRAGVDSKKNRD